MFSWKAVLKGIGVIAEQTAVATVPGAAAADVAVHELIESKTGADKEKAIVDSVQAGINELALFRPEDLTPDNLALLNQGIVDAHNAFDKIAKALGKAPAGV